MRRSALCMVLVLAACGGGGSGFLISGTVIGLSASGLTVTNGTDTIAIAADATMFQFPTALAETTGYVVSVVTQPSGSSCSVVNGVGTVDSIDIDNVVIDCVPTFSISGTLSGVTAAGLVLADGVDRIDIAPGSVSFAFPTPLVQGSAYSVTVTTEPVGQSCSVANGSGTVGAAAITDIAVSCD